MIHVPNYVNKQWTDNKTPHIIFSFKGNFVDFFMEVSSKASILCTKCSIEFCAHPVGTSPLPPWTFDCTCCIVHSLDGSAYLLPVRGEGQHSEVNRFHKKNIPGRHSIGQNRLKYMFLNICGKAEQSAGDKTGVPSFHCTSLKEGVCVCVFSMNEALLRSAESLSAAHYLVLPYPATKKYLPDLRMLPGQENKSSIKAFTHACLTDTLMYK